MKETVTLESPNYRILYLDISDSAPQKFEIVFTNGKRKITHNYELKPRDPERLNIQSFNSSDVLYLIMPDRFANGNPDNDQIAMRMPYKVDRNDPQCPPRRRPERHIRAAGLFVRPGRNRHLAQPGAGERHGGRFVPRIRHHRLLPRGSPVRHQRGVRESDRRRPFQRNEGGDGYDFQPLRQRSSLDARRSLARLVQQFGRIRTNIAYERNVFRSLRFGIR